MSSSLDTTLKTVSIVIPGSNASIFFIDVEVIAKSTCCYPFRQSISSEDGLYGRRFADFDIN